MNTHIVRSFDEEPKYLANRIAAMGGHAERMVDQAVLALVDESGSRISDQGAMASLFPTKV
jgi:hypothetical protein